MPVQKKVSQLFQIFQSLDSSIIFFLVWSLHCSRFYFVSYARLIYRKFDKVGVVLFGTRGINFGSVDWLLILEKKISALFCVRFSAHVSFFLYLFIFYFKKQFLETDNVLTKEVGGYEHVVVLRDIEVVNEDLVDAFQELPRGTFDGDCIHGFFYNTCFGNLCSVRVI